MHRLWNLSPAVMGLFPTGNGCSHAKVTACVELGGGVGQPYLHRTVGSSAPEDRKMALEVMSVARVRTFGRICRCLADG